MSTKLGVLYAFSAFVIFGLYPIYLKQIHDVPAMQLTLHRIVWSFVTSLPVFLYKREWKNHQIVFTYYNVGVWILSAVSLGGAWILYVWGVTSGHIIETSLGFFINPLCSILLAVFVLRETLRFYQKIAVALAGVGVVVVAVANGTFPWLGICLGALLSLYGLSKKKTSLPSAAGVTIELGILVPPCVAALVVLECNGSGVMHSLDAATWALVIGTGITSVVPLLLFASAAHMIPLTLLGILQYTGPVLTFLLGLFVYNESFSTLKLIGFILVWIALAIFATESVLASRRKPEVDASTASMTSPHVSLVVESSEISSPDVMYLEESSPSAK